MGRPKKDEKDDIGENAESGITTEQYTRTRDSVITGLTTLQSAIGDLIHAYLAHTNNILGGGPSTGADTLAISNPLGFSGTSVDIASKKKKAKKERDPNAPKRPLTAYFLYAQHARKIIREDLGADNIDLKPGDIATEATRRWHAMSLEEQEKWKALYKQKWKTYVREEKEYLAKHNIEAQDGELDASEIDDGGSEGEVNEELLRDTLHKSNSPAKMASPAKVKKSRGKDTGENGTPARNATSNSSPSRRAMKETPIPLPGSVAATEPVSDARTKGGEKRRKKDHESDEPRKKRSRKSNGAEVTTGPDKSGQISSPQDKRSRKRKSEGAKS